MPDGPHYLTLTDEVSESLTDSKAGPQRTPPAGGRAVGLLFLGGDFQALGPPSECASTYLGPHGAWPLTLVLNAAR